MGEGEIGMMLTPTEEESEGSGAEYGPGGAAAGGGATLDATSKNADRSGAGDRHGAGKRERERVVGQQKTPAGKS